MTGGGPARRSVTRHLRGGPGCRRRGEALGDPEADDDLLTLLEPALDLDHPAGREAGGDLPLLLLAVLRHGTVDAVAVVVTAMTGTWRTSSTSSMVMSTSTVAPTLKSPLSSVKSTVTG